MKLYIIMKDGEPYCSQKDTFTKSYFDEDIAIKVAKGFCSSDAGTYYRYGQGYYDNEDLNSYERDKLAKKLSKVNFEKHWKVKEVDLNG